MVEVTRYRERFVVMHVAKILPLFGLLITLSACAGGTLPSGSPEQTWLSPSEKAFLNIQRPYPNDDDVCVLLGESENTVALKAQDQELIACPKHETGATEDRRRTGGKIVGQSTYWVILSISSDLVKE